LLDFYAKTANATEEWLEAFHSHLKDRANNQSWLGADLPWRSFVPQYEPDETTLWVPANSLAPPWLSTSPSCLLLTVDLEALGEIRSVWQAKKYRPTSKVKLSELRELSAVREAEKATKGVMGTTSRLSRDAIVTIMLCGEKSISFRSDSPPSSFVNVQG
jgi:hypothetical protein